MSVYSSLKPAWHLDRIAQLREGRDVAPVHVHFVISDLCNQNCHFCAYRMDGGFSTADFADEQGNRNPVRFIPTPKAMEILDDCAALGVRAIEFTGGGEPTVHPDWEAIIGYAQALGLQTGLVTNGVRLKQQAVLEKLTWLRISVDAGRSETYQRIRQSAAWPQVIRALGHAGTLKGPLVGVGFVVTRENWQELYEGARITRDAGIAYLRISAMFSAQGAEYYAGLEAGIAEQRALAKSLEDGRFKVVDNFSLRVEDLAQQAPDYAFCGFQQFVVYIGGNQKVYTCCTNAYTPHGEIGDLKHQRFAQWLKATRRFDFDARSCHHCQYNNQNRVINFLLEKKPAHVNFV